MNNILRNKTILLFDGYCNLCHSSVKFVMKQEKKQELYFTSLQSSVGLEILNYYKIDASTIDSLVLIEKNKAYIKSTAALRLSKYLKGIYAFGYIFIIVPHASMIYVVDVQLNNLLSNNNNNNLKLLDSWGTKSFNLPS